MRSSSSAFGSACSGNALASAFSVLSGPSSLLGWRLLGGQQVAPGGVPAEHAPEHRGRLSPREERGALRRVPARVIRRGGDRFSPVAVGPRPRLRCLGCGGGSMAC
jgi:hypothetical protein